MGEVCIAEVAMGAREDVAKFLCEKHNASIDIEFMGGTTVRNMVNKGSFMASPVQMIIRKHGEKQSIREHSRCINCKKVVKKNLVCSRCKNISYCSSTCQREHWKEHKKMCQRAERNEIKLNRPTFQVPSDYTRHMVSVTGRTADGDYKRPDGVAVDEIFWMKVQADINSSSLLLYDKTRTCTFTMLPEDVGFNELLEKVRAEKGAMGQKCHVEALFDKEGDCRVYPSTATLRKW
mmetsp:Transcript_22573/g.33141  ORF Transcript_22573/g.33141 Transcript_22573/m.33141 type:complete len:235 (+) Transcript_22573:89-793(+)